MHKDSWYFFGIFQPPIDWCMKGKKFEVSTMSARYSRKILVYILRNSLSKEREMCRFHTAYVYILSSFVDFSNGMDHC